MKKKNTKKATKQDLNFVNDEFAVSRVNNYSDELTFFNLHLKSALGVVTIYGCMVVSGDNGDFISFPARKDQATNKYYNHAYIKLTDEQQDAIIEEVANNLT